MHGFGIFRYKDGKIYKGEYRHGKQHGEGILIEVDKSKRKGEWVKGERIRWIQ